MEYKQGISREYNEKIARVHQFLNTHGLDGILLSRRDSFSWITCGSSNFVGLATERGAADILVTKDKRYIFLTEIEKYRISDEELSGLDFEVITYDWMANKEKIIKEVIGGKIVASDTGDFGLQNVLSKFVTLQYALMTEEIERLTSICSAVSDTVWDVSNSIEIGNSEYEIAAIINQKLISQGFRVPACLIAADERIKKYRHPIPKDKKLEKYALLVVVGEKYGLHVSMSRMISFGAPSKEILSKHEACMRVDTAFIGNTVAGAIVSDVFNSGVKYYEETGYPNEWKLHHQGGPMGYRSREYRANFESNEVVRENQAFAWNPTIAGTKCEDTILVTDDGPNVLTGIDQWPMKEMESGERGYKRPLIMIR